MQAPSEGLGQGLSLIKLVLNIAASARVAQLAVALFLPALRRKRFLYLLARASAAINQTTLLQVCQRGVIACQSGRLPQHRAISQQAVRCQLLHDLLAPLALAARRIHIFYAQQPSAAVRARIQPAGQSRQERAGMQRPRGRRCKAARVGRRVQMVGHSGGVQGGALRRKAASLSGCGLALA